MNEIYRRGNFAAATAETSENDPIAERRHAQKMEALGRLACGITHDFNNLLTIIGGYARILLDCRCSAKETEEALLQILRASDQATAFTRQLLNFSSSRPAATEVVNVNEMLKDCTRMLSPLLGIDIEVTVDLARDVPAMRAVPGHLLQILLNLAANARDAMPNGGSVTFETAVQEGPPEPSSPDDLSHRTASPTVSDIAGTTLADLVVEVANVPRWIVITVSDTGTGIDPDVQSRIFEPFFTTKPEGCGTGLGLAMVDELVRQMGGHIRVENRPGRGASFALWFPACETIQTNQPPAPTPEPSTRGNATILLVEDMETARTMFRRMLANEGYTVLTAASGAAAIAMATATARSIDLLITDVAMPRMDGVALAEQLTATYPGLRVLFVSGFPSSVLSRRGHLPQEPHFMQKPFGPQKLLSKVREILFS